MRRYSLLFPFFCRFQQDAEKRFLSNFSLRLCLTTRCLSDCVLQKVMRRSQHARKETEFLRLKRTRLGLDDFESLKVIGRGAFGEVRSNCGKAEGFLNFSSAVPFCSLLL